MFQILSKHSRRYIVPFFHYLRDGSGQSQKKTRQRVSNAGIIFWSFTMISQHCEATKFSTLLTLSIIDNPQVNSNTNVSMPCMTQIWKQFQPAVGNNDRGNQSIWSGWRLLCWHKTHKWISYRCTTVETELGCSSSNINLLRLRLSYTLCFRRNVDKGRAGCHLTHRELE